MTFLLRYWKPILAAMLLAAAFLWGYSRARRAALDAAAIQSAALADANATINAERRVHTTDLELGKIGADTRLALNTISVQTPAIIRESDDAIRNAPALRTVVLPAALVRLRKQQAEASAALAAERP